MDSKEFRKFMIDSPFSSYTTIEEKFERFLQTQATNQSNDELYMESPTQKRKSAKTSAERQRECRIRKKLRASMSATEDAVDVIKSVKTNAEKQREYRLRKKLRASISATEDAADIIKSVKTNAEKQREYRLRKKLRASMSATEDAADVIKSIRNVAIQHRV